MEQTTVTIQLEAGKREQFEALCEQFGSSVDKVFGRFVDTVISTQTMPISLDSKKPTGQEAWDAFIHARQSRNSNEPEMTLEEINEEIRLARAERKARLAMEQQ